MAQMPAPICSMASVMMKDGMPITVTPTAVTQPSAKAASSASRIASPARQRQVGDVDVGFLQREERDRDAGDVGECRDREVDLGGEDDEGEAGRDDRGDRDLAHHVGEVVDRGEGRAQRAEHRHQEEQGDQGCEVGELGRQPRAPAGE